MLRQPIALVAALAVTAGAATAAPSPAPAPRATAKHSTFSNSVRVPRTASGHVSAADCSRRAVGINPPHNTMGPSGASNSQTLVAIPIGGKQSVASATSQSQINEICNHQRR